MRGKVSAALVGLVGFFLAAVGSAQSGPDNDPAQAQGFADNYFHHSSFDSINQYNGQLTVPVSIGPTFSIGPNLSFQVTLTYNTRVTEPGHPTDETSPNYFPVVGDPALGIGWSFTPGKIACLALPTSPLQFGPCWIRPDGGQTDFPTGGGRASDGSSYELVHNGAWPNDTWTLFDGDGNRFEFARRVVGYDDNARESPQQGPGYARDFGRGRDGYYLTSIQDPFGNQLTVDYAADGVSPCPSVCAAPAPVGSMRCPGGTALSWIPASFRIRRVGEASSTEIVQIVTDASLERIKSFRIKTFRDGVSQFSQWDLTYGSVRLTARAPNLYCATTLPTLAGISMPADIVGTSGYSFSYFPETGIAAALLRSMTLPTGATVFYDYGNYHFYHGRRAMFGDSDPCWASPSPPPPSQGVRRSSILTDSGGPGHRPEEGDDASERYAPTQGPCLPYTNSRQYEQHLLGVVQRAVSGPGLPDSVTSYTQYSFPFGENGNTDAQTLTVALLPPDADGVRRAETTLFWAAKEVVEPDSPPTPGDRLGADLRHAIFEEDPNPAAGTLITPPLCGGGAEEDKLCATHAVRVTQNLFQYDADGPSLPGPSDDGGVRRLRRTTTYYGRIAATDPLSADYCPGCLKHTVTYALAGAGNWEGNGRHYDRESHSGNLGGDRREITTAWTPQSGPRLWNLYSSRIETDPDIPAPATLTGTRNTIDRSFFFDPATGFLQASLTWDDRTTRYSGDCRYPDASGRVADEVTANVVRTLGKPTANPCFPSVAQWSPGVLGMNGDAFASRTTHAGGLPASRRWIRDKTPLAWYSDRVDRDSTTGWTGVSYDTAGLATAFRYDGLGRIVSIAPPGEAPTSVVYADARTTTASRSGADDSSWQRLLYDGLGRLNREIRQMPSGYSFRAHAYDAAGHERFTSEWKSCSSVAATGDCVLGAATLGTTFSSFDPFGRAQAIAKADSSLTTISFTDGATPYSDTRKAVTVANVGCTWNGSSCAGGASSTSAYRYDASGRLVTVLEPGGDITTYAYDVAGKLVSVAQGAQTRTFAYDALGYLIRETTPEAGTADYTAFSGTTTYANWGSLGNPRGRVDAWGTASPVTRSYQYDAAGRELCEISGTLGAGQTCDSSGLSLYVRNYYDGDGFAGGAYPLGKLTRRDGYNRVLSPVLAVREEMKYSDPTGRLSEQTISVRNGATVQSTATQRWTYDALGLVKEHAHPRTAPGSFTAFFGRSQGYVTSIAAGGRNVVNRVSYAPSGALASWTAGNGPSGADGVVTTIAPDTALLPRPSRISTSGAVASSAGGNFDTGTYRYDGAGNIAAIGPDTFGYDPRSRLTSAAYSGAGGQTFSYDRYGNLLSDGSAQPFCVTTCAQNRLAAPYAYDARGNLTGNGSAETLTYDELSRQVRYQSTGSVDWRYLYTGAGERAAKLPAGGTAQYTYRDEANRVSTEYWGATLGRDNVFLGNLLVASYVSSSIAGTPGWQWYHSDHLGTPRLVTDTSRTVVESRKYWPYGNGIPGQSGTLQKLRFCAMERDTENFRYYDHMRLHDAVAGRFASPDVAGTNLLDPQAWNRYGYAGSNPLKFVDPDGEEKTWAQELASFGTSVGQAAMDSSIPGSPNYSAGEIIRDTSDMLNLGVSTGEALGAGEDSFHLAIAVSRDVGRFGGWLLAIGSAGAALEARAAKSFEVVQRAMSSAELEATRSTGLIRGGREGTHYVSDAVNSDPLRARQRLALPKNPEVRATLEVPRGVFSKPTRIEPRFNMPGGGTERKAKGLIKVRVIDVLPYK